MQTLLNVFIFLGFFTTVGLAGKPLPQITEGQSHQIIPLPHKFQPPPFPNRIQLDNSNDITSDSMHWVLSSDPSSLWIEATERGYPSTQEKIAAAHMRQQLIIQMLGSLAAQGWKGNRLFLSLENLRYSYEIGSPPYHSRTIRASTLDLPLLATALQKLSQLQTLYLDLSRGLHLKKVMPGLKELITRLQATTSLQNLYLRINSNAYNEGQHWRKVDLKQQPQTLRPNKKPKSSFTRTPRKKQHQ